MKHMLDGYLTDNKKHEMTQEQIKEVEAEVSKRLEQEVGQTLALEGKKITNDIEANIDKGPMQQQQHSDSLGNNYEASPNDKEMVQDNNAMTNMIQQKLSTAGNDLKNNMSSIMENIEKQVLN